MARPAGVPAYNVAADPYVMGKKAAAMETEAYAMDAAISEFREWDTVRNPGELLKIWASTSREEN